MQPQALNLADIREIATNVVGDRVTSEIYRERQLITDELMQNLNSTNRRAIGECHQNVLQMLRRAPRNNAGQP
jgi:hypothetical protein